MEYYKIDSDNEFVLFKKAIPYKYLLSQGTFYDIYTSTYIGHSLILYKDQNGRFLDKDRYELHFKNGEVQKVDV